MHFGSGLLKQSQRKSITNANGGIKEFDRLPLDDCGRLCIVAGHNEQGEEDAEKAATQEDRRRRIGDQRQRKSEAQKIRIIVLYAHETLMHFHSLTHPHILERIQRVQQASMRQFQQRIYVVKRKESHEESLQEEHSFEQNGVAEIGDASTERIFDMSLTNEKKI